MFLLSSASLRRALSRVPLSDAAPSACPSENLTRVAQKGPIRGRGKKGARFAQSLLPSRRAAVSPSPSLDRPDPRRKSGTICLWLWSLTTPRVFCLPRFF
ncbi:unnamed protein product [Phaeothamnion confervicola]